MKNKYYLLLFVAFFLILFLRRPDALLNAQFWAEDGAVWFANAYNLGGVKSLLLTQDGYFQTLSRVTALISLGFPTDKAPLIFNSFALLIQALPAMLIISPRFEKIIPKFSVRLLLTILYLFLPNTTEVHANITNAQWFLALAAFMILVTDAGKEKCWKVFDFAVLLLAGLSGPFSIFLFPVAAIYWFIKREGRSLRNLIVVSLAGVVQLVGIFLLNSGGRLHHLPEFSTNLILAIFAKQIVWGSLIGASGYNWVVSNIGWHFWFLELSMFLALLLAVYSFFKAPVQLKLFLLFGGLIFAAGLISPTGDFSEISQLRVLFLSDAGIRYWLIPMSAFISLLVWGLSRTNYLFVRILSGVFLVLFTFGAVIDFKHPNFIDYRFSDSIEAFEKLPAGQEAIIPINPPGVNLNLVKR